eukprot:38906_1
MHMCFGSTEFIEIIDASMNGWPFYSVYSHETNNVFCDFWYMTQTSVEDELQLCDCKVNNGHYCISWICATIAGYDFDDTNHSNADLLAKLLLPNQIEIFGVHQCGYFTDHALISRNHEVKQYCYKYDDFKSCYCKPNDDANATQLLYCAEWVCHQYVNKAKNSLSFDADYDASKAGKYHNYWNASDRAPPSDVNVSSVIDMMKLSLKTTHEEYRCTSSYSNTDRIANHYDIVDKTECVEWKGNVVESDASSFRVMSCATEGWNSDTSTFTQIAADQLSGYNMSTSDLVDTYSYKWQCRLCRTVYHLQIHAIQIHHTVVLLLCSSLVFVHFWIYFGCARWITFICHLFCCAIPHFALYCVFEVQTPR